MNVNKVYDEQFCTGVLELLLKRCFAEPVSCNTPAAVTLNKLVDGTVDEIL